ncbi:phytanoyl-CoA dioxygenase family protein [Bacillaceae bacterium SIJ1]|uniref:phytanoyl-CoA dioxygenase family protein n=1 Tax=Litoribacterium kuwaitense TaxID=1398745 RepID=UPI0013ED6BCE|nr:phytanoyl-CoA dioxygenase family protein [Litoribacterium kuwaitense]NGP44598.1 phytanoyl-CoA dioxygenase family protein [Litoribacterium kuwaitense]
MDKHRIREWMKAFDDQGYLILRNVLTEDEVAKLNTAIDEIIAEEPQSLSYNIYNSVERHPDILRLIDEPTILPLIVNLLGYNIQLHISHLTIREPNPNEIKTETNSFINWHQDGPNLPFPKINGLTSTYYIKTCYILSDMSQPDRGNTKVIPGSHKRPDNPNQLDVRYKNEDEVQVCGKPGDVFIFPQNLWHAGSPNKSEFTRRQLFLGYSPLWMRPIDYHQASERLLKDANPNQKQLLGDISTNKFHYYVPQESMVPLKAFYYKDAVKSVYDH